MSDLIDRQSAIDCVMECYDNNELFEVYEDKLRELPPAQPDVPDINVGDKDTISRKAAIDALGECYCGGEDSCGEPWIYQENAVEAIQMIEPILPAEPKITRCKDCKHWIPYDWMFSEVWQSKNMADYPEDEIGCNYCDMAMKANDFCSRGERREE